jgi:hypothetical protein
MNSKINALNEAINQANANISDIKAKLQLEWDKVFNDSHKLKTVVENAMQASEYQWGRDGEIESWYRYADLQDHADCKEYFENWLHDQGVYVEWEHDCLLVSQGDSIVINHDGDVFDTATRKTIISKSDYTDEADIVKRNALIEEHMEKTGYFPGVFSSGYHGNVFLVNTQSK